MFFRNWFILLFVYEFQLNAAIDIRTGKQCCNLGTNHSIAGNQCNNFPTPIPGIDQADYANCLQSAEVCCRRRERDIQCQEGESLALEGGNCNSADGTKRSCCETCALGKSSSASNPNCEDYLDAGPLFVKCCETALRSSSSTTISTTTTSTTRSTPSSNASKSFPSMENLCEVEGICAQICIPIGDSYKCDCNKGYSLMNDGVSCKLDKKIKKGINRCNVNNPCEQECVDTGVAIKCSCREGYELDVDNTSCRDVDECARGTHECHKDEVCVNDEGNYYCEDPSYTDVPIDYEKKCPVGFKFNGEKSVCDDINECEISLLCPSFQTCRNTMGSYTCEKESLNCPPGFYSNVATESCLDIDECITGDNNCNTETEICINSKGNYSCVENLSKKVCPAGFKKNPDTLLCDDIDECVGPVPVCAANEQCVNEKGSYNCIPKPTVATTTTTQRTTTRPPYTSPTRPSCAKGFMLSPDQSRCLDVNECQMGIHGCTETQRCDNTVGSYHCVRTAGCGTGYTYNHATELCEDDDECLLGVHNCGGLGSGYKCRNTLGSYRCDPVRRTKPTTISTTRRFSFYNPTTEPTIISGQRKSCLPGYRMDSRGECVDVDECESNPCGRGESCLNLQGRYHCITKVQCKAGYDLNDAGDGCEDVNECERGTHKCNPTQICRNGDGYYTCECPPGHHLNPQSNNCEDIDECRYYKVCYYNANCVNTIGSYKCECKEGFRDNGASCDDIDECAETPNLCQHKCVNLWGSYRCACQSGFTLNVDNRTCSDIDECEMFKDKKLCIGPCQNIPGSYACTCPSGYRLGTDGRTCQDIDECDRKVCPKSGDICVNTRGNYKCYSIDCPSHYIRDPQHRSRCKKPQNFCDPRDIECILRPEQYTYHFIDIVSDLPVLNGGMNLFTIQGPNIHGTRTEFFFKIVNINCPSHVPRINDNYFRVEQDYKVMKLYLTRSIRGPQEAQLEIQMKLFDKNQLTLSTISRLYIIVTEYPF